MSRITTSRPSARARSIPSWTALTGSAALVGVNRDADLLAELHELVDCRRTLQVGRHERRLLPLVGEQERELAGRGRLPGALQAREEDRRGRPLREREPGVRGAEELGQLLVDDLHDLLARREALPHVLAERALAHVRDELLDDAEVDVRLEQGEPHLAHGAGDRLLVEDAAPAEVAEGALELFAERVEHRRARVPGRSVRLAAVRRGALVIAPFVVLLLAACGSSGGSNSTTQQQQRLTPALYRAQIAKIKRDAAKAQSDVSQGLGAKNVSALKQKIDAFAAATQSIGDEVAALNPPQNAAAANTQLAQGLHDIAAGTRTASAKIANLTSVGAAIAYLEHSQGPVKGSREVSKALATLQRLGYTTGS